MHVIPAINAASYKEAKAQFQKLAPLGAEMIHLDIADGKFTPNVTWGSPEELRSLIPNSQFPIPNTRFEIHLMVAEPEKVIEAWLETGLVKRIIVHIETMTNREAILEACKKYNVETMLAVKPETPVEKLLLHKDQFHSFQILAVPPGRAGQKFDERVLVKSRALRTSAPHATIEVDGGIIPDVARKCKDAGADVVVSASYIVNSPSPQQAYEEFHKR